VDRRGRNALLALALLLVAAMLWRYGSRPALPPVASAPANPAPAEAPTAGSARAEEPEPELPEAVQRYLEATVYPPSSGALEADSVDLLEPNRRYERMKRVPGSLGVDPPPSFLWTADGFHYTSDEVVHASFEAVAGDLPARVLSLEAFAQPEGRAGAEGEPIRLVFRPRGNALLADLDLSRKLSEHHGPVALTARYRLPRVEPQEETIRIFVTPATAIPARFTGNFRDRVRDGGLEIEAGIEVDEPGFYRIDANLYDDAGHPIAWAVRKGELGRHDGVVALHFFGKVLRDGGRAGPYELGQLRGYLFRDGEFPDRLLMRSHPGRYRTRAYDLADFSDDEWDGAHRRQMVELLLEDERRGLAVEIPPLATPGPPPPGAR
jgi:hypothetical protein